MNQLQPRNTSIIGFRRFHGRVIPIRRKTDSKPPANSIQKDAAIGGGLVAASVSVGVAAGVTQKKLFRAAESALSRADYYARQAHRTAHANAFNKIKPRAQMTFEELGHSGFARTSGKTFRKAAYDAAMLSKRLTKLSGLAPIAVKGLAAGLGTLGAYKIGEAIEKKNESLGAAFKISAPAIGGLAAWGSFGVASGLLKKRELLGMTVGVVKKVAGVRL